MIFLNSLRQLAFRRARHWPLARFWACAWRYRRAIFRNDFGYLGQGWRYRLTAAAEGESIQVVSDWR